MYRTLKKIPILIVSNQLPILITNIELNLINPAVLAPTTISRRHKELQQNHLLLQPILPSNTARPSTDH